ncbi:MAG TPA: ATP-binding protein [Sphingobacteriaceae bacterium]|nr:ATP-binding protein [Sphingobacteriaceae bacterium]
MITRLAAKQLDILLSEFPAIALLGPRQVGKTTLAKSLAKKHQKDILYFDLESDADVAKLKDPDYIFNEYKDHCIILDEVQRVPKLFSQLRPIIDSHRKPGRFILTGSASPDLVKGVSESLAGRIAFNELSPINLVEAKKSTISQSQHWYRGGFPLALTAADDKAFIRWTENFIRTYIERDLSQLFGVKLQEKLIRNFWYMLAANNGGIWNSETYARSLGISGPTIKRYLDFLEGAFLIRQLPAWYVNANKRLVKSPKIYLRDTGLLHVINRVGSAEELPININVGASWEGYVIEQIFQLKPAHIDLYFYRTHHGAECDLLLVNGLKPVMGIEIKYSSNPVLSKGFYTVMDDLKLPEGRVIVPRANSAKLHSNIHSSNLTDFISGRLQEL